MKSKTAFLIFPNQLFKDVYELKKHSQVFLIEEFLLFKQYNFHKQKLVFHRASMKYYEKYLNDFRIPVTYVEATDGTSDIRLLIKHLKHLQFDEIFYYDVCDNWLENRISKTCLQYSIKYTELVTPLFINAKADLETYFTNKSKFFHTDFYILQRKKWRILTDENLLPVGNRWSLDAENRRRYPNKKIAPSIRFPSVNIYYTEAVAYVRKNFPNNYGEIHKEWVYPVTHFDSEQWFLQFLHVRFAEFGTYEDAVLDNESVLHHSVLSPLLNAGLLQPFQVVYTAIEFASKNAVPLNSVEGFVRQILGWREFIRAVYVYAGTKQRTTNFLKFEKPISPKFYEANTGLLPIDHTVRKVLKTGYCHHIERLMILGNYLLLCKTHPNAVYRWFMEAFVDAYDWVMVPNVYGMSQYADGGRMSSKPYVCGSSYILKMSNYTRDHWAEVWDALFWDFIHNHRNLLQKNHRLAVLVKTFDKFEKTKKEYFRKLAIAHLEN